MTWALLQALEHDRFKIVRNSRIERTRSGRLLLAHLPQSLENRIGPERRLAGQQLVEDHAQRVDVDGRRDRLTSALSLLGCHVARGPHDRSRRGDAAPFRRLDPLGQAEVGHQGNQAIERIIRAASEQDIGRLQVPVQDSALMSVMHGASHRRHQARGIAGVVPKSGGQQCEIAAFDQLHAEIVVAFVLTHLIDRDDMGMIEVRGGLGLEPEPHQVIGGGEPPGPNHFERQHAIQADLASTVDNSHAPLRNHALQFVVAKILDVARAWLGRQTFTRQISRFEIGHGFGGERKADDFRQVISHAIGRAYLSGHRAVPEPAQRLGQPGKVVLVGEEGGELDGQIGLARKQVGSVGCRARLDRFEIGGDDAMQPLFTV